MGIVHAVRRMRADLGLTPMEPVPIVLLCPDDRRARIEASRRYIAPLVRASELRVAPVGDAAARPAGSVSAAWGPIEIALPLGSDNARAALEQRLRKQISGVERDLGRLEERLRSPAFLGGAPGDVIDADRARARDLAARRELLAGYLAGLGV
jgi:valyl-tRNA synthetase